MIQEMEAIDDVERLFEVSCDGTGCYVVEEVEGVWEDVQDFLNSEGWKYFKEDGKWTHLCPECKVKADFP